MSATHTGTLKYFRPIAGYGWVINDAGADDFLHVTVLRESGIDPTTLKENARFSYELGPGRKGRSQIVSITSLDN
jgi:cold shock CspA family protein